MNSQLNNQQTENQENQIFSAKEDQFRPVFFDSTTKRSNPSTSTSSSTASSSSSSSSSTHTNTNTSTPPPGSISQPCQNSKNSPVSTASDLKANKRARIEVLLMDRSCTPANQDQDSVLVPTPISPNTVTDPCSVSVTPVSAADSLPLANQQQKTIPQQEGQNLSSSSSSHQQENTKQQQQQQQQIQQHAPSFSNIKRYRSRSLPNVIFSALRRHHHHHRHHHHNNSNNNINNTAPTSSAHGNPSDSVINAVPSMAFSFPQQQPFFPPASAQTTCLRTSSPPLPPVNLKSLREIDLHEILKNPQLRHDILFDPQLQFRPNLDGERGRKKKMAVDKYWEDVHRECELYFVHKSFNQAESVLPPLFQTLKEILISLLPTKDVDQVNEVMDTDLLIQQLRNFAFDVVSLAKWLSQIFKSHCAPMRDSLVDEMTLKFVEAKEESSIAKLIDGLRLIFSILEYMKLDVANHQIRILRPVLVETAVDFEKNYFTQMVNRSKMNLEDSTNWFVSNYKKENIESRIKLKELSTLSILKLLSCRHMVTSFPTSLAFDHARLVLLRADIRQLVCLQLCVLLYKQMLHQYPQAQKHRALSARPEHITRVKKEILAIVTDDNGNVKWTRNVGAIALQLSKQCITPPTSTTSTSTSNFTTPPESMVEFAFNWLIKQTQPSSAVYGLMEEKIIKQLAEYVNIAKEDDISKDLDSASSSVSAVVPVSPTAPVSKASFLLPVSSTSSTSTQGSSNGEDDENAELNQLGSRVAKLCNFHWSVFGSTYTEAVAKLP